MKKNRSVAVIFSERPKTWGLRDDPYLYDEMKGRFNEISLPLPCEDFTEYFNRFFMEITSSPLTEESSVYVKRYDRGGMSSGRVSGSFWVNTMLPELQKRLEDENARLE